MVFHGISLMILYLHSCLRNWRQYPTQDVNGDVNFVIAVYRHISPITIHHLGIHDTNSKRYPHVSGVQEFNATMGDTA